MPKPLHLALFGAAGPWENWQQDGPYRWDDPELDLDVARIAERAKLDMIFFADTLALPEHYQKSYAYAARIGASNLDPMITLAQMSAVTSRIGLTATVSTTFTPPYLAARQFATLDHISRGRAGWNVVTSADVAAGANFGVDLPPHDLRYDMADEHLQVCKALWNSWEKDAVIEDRENMIFADHTKIHRVDFEGRWYKARGPFNHPPIPQGQPVIIMAGTSPRGVQFAAENADLTIAHKDSAASMKRYSAQIREALVKAGRDPASCKIFFAIRPWIGATEAEAKEKMERNAANARVEDGVGRLSYLLGHDMSQYDLDAPLSPDLPVTGHLGGYLERFKSSTIPTIREIAMKEAAREDMPIYGTADQVAEYLGALAEEVDADGYHFRYATKDYPYVVQLTSELVPALRRRGLFRSEYAGATLKDHLFGPQILDKRS